MYITVLISCDLPEEYNLMFAEKEVNLIILLSFQKMQI